MKRNSFGKAYFLKLKFAAPMRLALSKSFLDDESKCRLLFEGLNISFPKVVKDTVKKYATVSVSKMIKVISRTSVRLFGLH